MKVNEKVMSYMGYFQTQNKKVPYPTNKIVKTFWEITYVL